MAHQLAIEMAERMKAGLKRRSLTTCARWAIACRVMSTPYAGKWTFTHHPWLREMHDSEAEINIGQKSAQMGYTETALNRTFFMIDVKNVDCLYVLPAQTPDASDFSAARFDPALELSPHLSNLFSDVKNVGHKRAGTANLYVRGSKSRSQLKSIPVGFIVLDEVDEMDEANIALAMERTAGQLTHQSWAISTPTLPEYGINKMFLNSTMEHYYFVCPMCSRHTELTFPDCLEITGESIADPGILKSFLKCKECKGRLHHEQKADWLGSGKWVATTASFASRGFYINQLYSSTITPVNLATAYLTSLRDKSAEQEFYNSKLGLAHIVAGTSVNDDDLNRNTGGYRKVLSYTGSRVVTMGIDQGRWIHWEIDEWYMGPYVNSVDLNTLARVKVISFGKVVNFEELDILMRVFKVNYAVIDALPERRKAFEFASRFPGRVKMCFYGNNSVGKQIHVAATGEPTITVDRTSWLDLSLGRFRSVDSISLPLDIDFEYKTHIKALVRRYEKDKNNNPVGRYVHGSIEDHYAHARNYAEIALPFAANVSVSQDITEPYS